ncbi:TadE family type IV pilus minor pilin [Luethyella okanaganae]|uniref:TadE family type IV pilus minor pilin n=1 Tax=Luethyella okanaganae TaxID=69372 RepID=A0ABW1VDQ1_9MICO
MARWVHVDDCAGGDGHESGCHRDRGSVTAEFAAVVPAVMIVLALCLGSVQIVGQQVRLVDTAADAARALARGDGPGRVAALVLRAVPGAMLDQVRDGEFVCARLSAPVAFAPLAAAGLTVSGSSCALAGGL